MSETMHVMYTKDEVEEATKLLLEMRDNCINGDKYDDPLREKKYKAINIAIDAIGRMPTSDNSLEEYMLAKDIIANNVKKMRKSKNISQRSLAKKCNISNSTVSRIESGETRVSLYILEIICEVLDCKLSDIINEHEIMNADIRELKATAMEKL